MWSARNLIWMEEKRFSRNPTARRHSPIRILIADTGDRDGLIFHKTTLWTRARNEKMRK